MTACYREVVVDAAVAAGREWAEREYRVALADRWVSPTWDKAKTLAWGLVDQSAGLLRPGLVEIVYAAARAHWDRLVATGLSLGDVEVRS